nr:Chain L, IRL1620 [Homo sapiens]
DDEEAVYFAHLDIIW